MKDKEFYDEQGGAILDGDRERSIYSPVCSYCAHKHLTPRHTCAAFHDRIPDEIWSGKNKHSQPVEGDQGILFKRRGS